ncbi:MAG: hypothetical protein ACLGXA_08215 [Acidobacteriota bacterium]
MTDLLPVRFVDLHGEGAALREVQRTLQSDQIPRRGDSFPLFSDRPPVLIVDVHLRPNAVSGAHWMVTYREPGPLKRIA